MTTLDLPTQRTDYPITLTSFLSLLGLVDALFNYFWTANGIHGTAGALLVIVSTLLMMLASGVIAARWVRGWLRGVLEALLALDFIGTALAAYLLEAWILLALVVLAGLAWIIHLVRPPVPASSLG